MFGWLKLVFAKPKQLDNEYFRYLAMSYGCEDVVFTKTSNPNVYHVEFSFGEIAHPNERTFRFKGE